MAIQHLDITPGSKKITVRLTHPDATLDHPIVEHVLSELDRGYSSTHDLEVFDNQGKRVIGSGGSGKKQGSSNPQLMMDLFNSRFACPQGFRWAYGQGSHKGRLLLLEDSSGENVTAPIPRPRPAPRPDPENRELDEMQRRLNEAERIAREETERRRTAERAQQEEAENRRRAEEAQQQEADRRRESGEAHEEEKKAHGKTIEELKKQIERAKKAQEAHATALDRIEEIRKALEEQKSAHATAIGKKNGEIDSHKQARTEAEKKAKELQGKLDHVAATLESHRDTLLQHQEALAQAKLALENAGKTRAGGKKVDWKKVGKTTLDVVNTSAKVAGSLLTLAAFYTAASEAVKARRKPPFE
ncbi:MAG: hypothetical protein V1811_02195 [Candidatus Micrarchaeota archaeon]